MAALHTVIDDFYKEPTVEVIIDGIKIRDVVSVDVSHSIDQLSTAKIAMLSANNVSPEDRVIIEQGYGLSHVRTFTGIVDTVEIDEYPLLYTVTCRDVLKKAIDTFFVQPIAFGLDVETQTYYYSTYSTISGGTFQIHEYMSLGELVANHPEANGNITSEGVRAEALVQWILVMCGFQEGTEIQVDSTEFFVGDISPARFHLETAFDACQQVADLIGWRVYADTAGIVRFKKRPRYQNDSQKIWNYQTTSDPRNIHRLKVAYSNVNLRNYVEVQGAHGITVVQRAESATPSSTPYRGVLVSSELIDTSGIATFFATRILEDLNRVQITADGASDGNPYLYPGLSIQIDSKKFTGTVLLEGVSSSVTADAGYKSTWNGRAFVTPIDGDTPFANIEAIIGVNQIVSIGDPTYIVRFTGSPSYSTAGPITSYEWVMPDMTTHSGMELWYPIPDTQLINGNTAQVQLTVWDGVGNTATTISGFTEAALLAMAPVKTRHLYGAMTNHAVGTTDTGENWNTSNTIAPVSVAASNFDTGASYTPSGYALFGTNTGIWKTEDVCLTFKQVLETDGVVLDVHIPERDASRALACTDSGEVWGSQDYGETWTQIGSFAFPIYQVRHAWDNFNYVMIVGSGINNVYQSFSYGADWEQDTAPFASATYNVLWNTAGSASNYYTHTSGVVAYVNNSEALELLPYSGAAIPAATVGIYDDSALMFVDTNGQHWVLSGSAASGVLVPTQSNPMNKTRHMIRDGEIDILSYFATQSGIYKSLDNNYSIAQLYYASGYSLPSAALHTMNMGLGSTGWGEMVAYGPLVTPIPPSGGGQVVIFGTGLIPTATGSQPSDGGFIAHQEGWYKFTDLSTGLRDGWNDITFSDNTLYILRRSPEHAPDEYQPYIDRYYKANKTTPMVVTSGYHTFDLINGAKADPKLLRKIPGTDRAVMLFGTFIFPERGFWVTLDNLDAGSPSNMQVSAEVHGGTYGFDVTGLAPTIIPETGTLPVTVHNNSGGDWYTEIEDGDVTAVLKKTDTCDKVSAGAAWDGDYNMLVWDLWGVGSHEYYYPDTLQKSSGDPPTFTNTSLHGDAVHYTGNSVTQPTTIYVTSDDTLYRVENYGLGTATSIYTTPNNANIAYMNVSCTQDKRYEYILVVYQLDGSTLAFDVSKDGGATFTRETTMPVGSVENIHYAIFLPFADS